MILFFYRQGHCESLRKMLSKVVYAVLSLVIALILICSVRTTLLTIFRAELPIPCGRNETEGYISAEEAWPRFRNALRFRTISRSPGDYNRVELRNLVNFLIESYPTIFRSPYVRHDIINEYSLLVSVQGQNKSLTPYLLAGHLDVVPVVQEEWTYEGFEATENEDGSMVYARGAIDNKASVMAQLEALSFMLSRGKHPQRGFFLAFGHDEEVGGLDGAARIAEELRRRGVSKLDFLLDEGMAVVTRFMSGFHNPIGAIGVTEKGSLYLNISVQGEGGHSSMPTTTQTNIGILSAAIARLEANPHDVICDEMTQNFIESISLDMDFPLNIITSNLWLFKPLVMRKLAKGISQALVRTTTVVTMFKAGVKMNVMAPSAWAIVNHRIHPKQTVSEIIEKDIAVINDERVTVTPLPGSRESHPISPHDVNKDRPYRILLKTMLQIHPDAIPAPVALIANTDTRHYLTFTKHIFRHYPFVLDSKTELHRFHGRDERISKINFEKAINFYYHLMLNVDTEGESPERHSHPDL